MSTQGRGNNYAWTQYCQRRKLVVSVTHEHYIEVLKSRAELLANRKPEIIYRIVAMSLPKEQILLIASDRQISSLTEIVTLQLKLHKFNFTTYGLSRRRILDVSNGIDEPGEIRLPLATTLFIAWAAVFFCIHRGIKSSGKVKKTKKHILKISIWILLVIKICIHHMLF